MTGFTRKKEKNPPVNKRIYISATFVLIIMFGSFGLRELFPDQPIIKMLFGGMNIFLFWAISFFIFHRVDDRFFREEQKNLKSNLFGRPKTFITKKILILTIIIVLLLLWSLQFFHGSSFILFWLVFLIIAFLIGLWVDYRRRKNRSIR